MHRCRHDNLSGCACDFAGLSGCLVVRLPETCDTVIDCLGVRYEVFVAAIGHRESPSCTSNLAKAVVSALLECLLVNFQTVLLLLIECQSFRH